MMNDYGHQNKSPLPRNRDEDDAEEEREYRDDGKSHRLQMSSVPSRDTYLELPMMSDIFTTPLPKVTFKYLRKKSIRKNSKDVRRGCDDVNADEQREHQGVATATRMYRRSILVDPIHMIL